MGTHNINLDITGVLKKFWLDRPENLTTIGWICRMVILATGVLFYIITVNIKKIFYKD